MRAPVLWSVLLAMGVACGPRGTSPLPAAGTAADDGAGGLARGSVRLTFAGAGEGDDDRYVENDRYERSYDYDPLAYAAFGYGGFGYGGFGYGGFGYGGLAVGSYGRLYSRENGDYDARNPGEPGAIEGALVWKADAGVAWPLDCPLARTARAGAAVAGAVVYLEKLANGRGFERTGGVLAVTPCGLAPAVQVIGPVPANVTVDNGGSRAARLAIAPVVAGAVPSRDHVELDPGGRVELPIARPGVFQVEAAGGAPAWVLGEAHPYYAITDAAGRFAIDLVPPGTYTLVLWSPPLVTAITAAGPQWSAPTIERRTVVVARRGVTSVQAALTPAR